MKVLNLGELTLVDSMGNDLSVVRAARISNGAVLPDWRTTADEKLIRYLAEHKHTSPFEHVTAQFYVKAPIFVIREWMRHRTLSYNEISARYKKMKPEFFYPKKVRIPDPANKQGSIEVDSGIFALEAQYATAYDSATRAYNHMIEHGVARELARAVLPVGTYSEMYVTGNLLNWMKFYKLRSSMDAQQEIRQYADAIGSELEKIAPISVAALRYNL